MKSTHLFFPCLALLLGFVSFAPAFGQVAGQLRNFSNIGYSTVGGVAIDADGVLKTVETAEMKKIGAKLSEILKKVPNDLNEQTTIRKLSLKNLNAAIKEIVEKREEFPDEIRYLGGLTALRYVVVVPEENDILLVGPAEGWKTDAYGNVVGKVSGRPVLQLEDLLTVFRTWSNKTRLDVISCSIDPTKEALAKIAQVDKQFAGATSAAANAKAAAYENAYGLNTVTVNGIPASSRFAKILVACDYKMKRFGIGQEPSGIQSIPSYTALINGGSSVSPRFWLAPEYGTVSHDSAKNVWKLSEVKVKALTEDEFFDEHGARKSTGKTDRAAVNWCDKMSKNYDSLCKVSPVFGDLKNCMNLAIAAALIHRENLLDKANCKLPMIAENPQVKPISYPVPKAVPSKSVMSRAGRSTIIVCGGVEINPFTTVQNAKLDSTLDKEAKTLVKTSGNSWWSK
jgi:hypothetical protein